MSAECIKLYAEMDPTEEFIPVSIEDAKALLADPLNSRVAGYRDGFADALLLHGNTLVKISEVGAHADAATAEYRNDLTPAATKSEFVSPSAVEEPTNG